jgi:hypothetical protein
VPCEIGRHQVEGRIRSVANGQKRPLSEGCLAIT